MKIALIADIHGNIFALDAVLDDAKKNGADTYIFVGDYICNMTFPNEAIERVRAVQENYPTYFVKGNKETLMKSMTQEDPSTWIYDQLGSVYQTFCELTPDNLEWLLSLPETVTIALPNNKSLFVQHILLPLYMDKNGKRYTFNALNETVYFKKEHMKQKFTHEEYLKQADKEFSQDSCTEQLAKYDADIIVTGHTHLQWYAFSGNKLLINPGSCGLPMDGSPLAPYTLLSVTEHGVSVEEHRVEYDVENAITTARKTAIYKNGSDFMEACLLGIRNGYDYISELRETAQRLSDEQRKPVPTELAVDNEIWRLAVREFFDIYGIKTKQRIRLIVTDLDGTLLRSDKTISDHTADILLRCRKYGILFAFATSRSENASSRFRAMANPDITITSAGSIAKYKEASKKNALMAVIAELGILPEEVVVFGDDYNDIDMLSLPGVVSVAMGNAIPEVKTIADYMCYSNDEDGVARWLEENVL